MGWIDRLWWMAAALLLMGGSALHAETRIDVCIARGRAAPAAMIAQPRRFDCRTPQARWGPGDFWAISRTLPPDLGRSPTLVRSYSLWQDAEAVWALYADGRMVALRPMPGMLSISTANEHALPARDVRVVRLLWRIRGAQNVRGILLGVRLTDVAEQARTSIAAAAVSGGIVGLCAAFLFFNLALWMALRRTFQLAYCAMVGGVLLFILASAGLFRRLDPVAGPLLDLRAGSLTFTLCVVGGLWFARSFLEAGILGPRGKRSVDLVILAVLALGLARDLLAPWQTLVIDRLQGVALVAAIVAIGFMAVRAWTRRSAYRLVWTGAALVPALLATMRAANSFQLTLRPFAMHGSLLMLMAAGMFASTLAIAQRVRRLARQRDEARAQEVAARLLADTDPLTGLMNRRAFLAQAIGREGPQTLLIADLDHFKAINETIGHDGGDEVLRAVARALATALPPGTLIARIGGEEFAVVAAADALVPAALIVDALRSVRMPFDLAVTASIGTCTGPLMREADWKALYRLADRALYAAKAAGRDRVRDAGVLPLAA